MRGEMLFVMSSAVPGREDEYHAWYDEVHVPDILAISGVRSARRCAVSRAHGDDLRRYLAIYEIDGDAESIVAEIGRRVGSGDITLSEAIDLTAMESWIVVPLSAE